VQVTISLPTYVPRGLVHQPPNGGQHGNSSKGSSSRINLPGEPPFNPHARFYGWPAPYPRMFIPPWYQPHVVQPVSKPTTKLPYMKLQHSTYVKDINLDAHIRMFNKAINTS
jgi:hypothetical protein